MGDNSRPVSPIAEVELSGATVLEAFAQSPPSNASPLVELVADVTRPGGRLLLVDRVRHSFVDLDDPGYLDFEYALAIAGVIDALPAGRLAVTHVGGGAGSLARYVHHTRPGSPQIMLEPNTRVTDLVREWVPYPKDIRLRIRPIGGREGMSHLASGSADAVVLDAFDGGHIPAELTTTEFLADVARVLRPGGVLLSNVADGPPLTYLRRAAASARAVFPAIAVIADPALFKRRRFGNFVLAAAATAGDLPLDEIERAAASAALPRRVMHGAELDRLIASAAPITDADATDSPEPPDEFWRVSLA